MILGTGITCLSILLTQGATHSPIPEELRPIAAIFQKVGLNVESGKWIRNEGRNSTSFEIRLRSVEFKSMGISVSLSAGHRHETRLFESMIPYMQQRATAEVRDALTHLPSRYPLGDEVIFMNGLSPVIRWSLDDFDGEVRGGGVGQPKADQYRLMERVAREAVNYWLVNSPTKTSAAVAYGRLQAYGRPAHLLLSPTANLTKGSDGVWRFLFHRLLVELPLGSKVAYVDGQPVRLSHPIVEQNGEPLVPPEVTRS